MTRRTNRPVPVRIIRTDGTSLDTYADPADVFGALYPVLGCDTIELVRLPSLGNPASIMLVDEDGIGRNRPLNRNASAIAHRTILGDVAIMLSSDLR